MAVTRHRAGRPRTILRVGAALGLVVVLLGSLFLGVRLTHRGEALPGTTIAGIDVGGMSRAEIGRRLAVAVDPRRPLLVVAGDQDLRVRPAQAGYEVDVEASATRAVEAGRSGALGGAFAAIEGLFSTRGVPLEARVDDARLRRTTAALVRRIDRPSFPGRLLVGAPGDAVGIEPPRAGRRVDRAMLTGRLREALLNPSRRRVDVIVDRLPVVSRETVEAIAADATAFLRAPLVLTGGGDPLTVEPERLAGLLVLEPLRGGRRARLGVAPEPLDALVAEIAQERDRPARDAKLEAPAGSVVVDGKEDVTWRPQDADVTIVPAQAGRAVEREALGASIADAVRAGSHRARLPVTRAEPAVTTRQARAAGQLIGTFTTYYEGGQPRVTNIQQMAETVDGTLIAPGEQLSLNGIVGERTTDKGYVEAPFIADGRLVPSVGGGVSQFATTMYNAAFFAGLQLDAHRPHSLFIDRYPAGREATLNYPDIDLAWTNDTDAPVLVRASAGDSSVTVSLYGDNGGREVRAETGARQPFDGGDFSIDVTRVIRYADGRTDESTQTTSYDLLEE